MSLLWTPRALLILVLALCSTATADDKPAIPDSPVSGEAALEFMQLPPGLRVELVATEPQVVDPVALRFDEQERLWVVEMRDYPHGPAEGGEPMSRIRLLEDRDGDGRYETAGTFKDHLLFVTGLMPWRGGVLVTLAGRVAYMKDTDGDGQADVDETWYTGFAQENSQLRANHPSLGLDNHIYIANGLRGGTVVDARKKDAKPISISGMDFRFDPLTDEYESISGVGQFGLTFDDYGNRFVCSNRNPLKHIVLEDRYLKTNPQVAVPAAFHDVAASGEQSKLYPISRAWTTSTLHAGQFTAACGVQVYRGDAIPSLYGNALTCDPTGNLIHREVMQPEGATFNSQRGREEIEFLASTDEWFRPVNVQNGPDGAIYFCDMYRAVIEHPQFMPEELKRRPDLRYGDDRGRIYRIVQEGGQPAKRGKKISEMSDLELAGQLEATNAWQRETAARLLFERQVRSEEVLTEIHDLAFAGRQPTVRVAALWLLEGLSALDDELVNMALIDKHPRVREQAVVLSATRMGEQNSGITERVLARAGDDDPKVRFQVAMTLALAGRHDVPPLVEILLRSADDPWTRRAVSLAAGKNAAELAGRVLERRPWKDRELALSDLELVQELTALVAASDDDQARRQYLAALVQLPSDESSRRLQRVALVTMADGLARRRTSLTAVLTKADASLQQAVAGAIARAAVVAADRNADALQRVEAVELLAHAPSQTNVLASLALKELSQTVRREAISALARHSTPETWQKLLRGFQGQSPTVRGVILDGALARTERTTELLNEIEAKRIKVGEIDRIRSSRLIKHRDTQIRQRAEKLFAAAVPEDRKKVLAEYQSVLQLKSDPRHGQMVFKKNCSTCHRIGKIGVNVAPDIGDSRTKQPAQILADILQPNRAIDANYISYSVVTTDGRALTGILASETATSVTLRQPENKSITLLRDEIDEIASNGISLMPEGLEKKVTHQEMADLIAFIKNWRYLDGRVPLGKE